jgi:hypothetical protein
MKKEFPSHASFAKCRLIMNPRTALHRLSLKMLPREGDSRNFPVRRQEAILKFNLFGSSVIFDDMPMMQVAAIDRRQPT